MIASLDSFGLLSLESKLLDTGKIYQHSFQGYQISSENHEVFVYHKKGVKIIEFKNIGSTMGVFHIQQREVLKFFPLNIEAFTKAWHLFEAWDEDIGQQYFFLPYFPSKEIEQKNTLLKQVDIKERLIQSPKGVVFSNNEKNDSQPENLEEVLSFLFGLVLLFGKLETKGDHLNAFKFHLPLFGQYLQIEEKIESIIKILQQEGIFLQSSKNEHNGQISYQVSSNDWEVLQLFSEWYKDIEKLSKITKKELALQAVEQVITFLQTQDIENTEEIKYLLENNVVKVLVKN